MEIPKRREFEQACSHGGTFGGSAPQIFFVPLNIVVPRIIFIKAITKQKILPQKFILPPNLKTLLWTCIRDSSNFTVYFGKNGQFCLKLPR